MWAIETKGHIDFESYSEAGFLWNEEKQTWDKLPGAAKKGISAVGTVAYAEHPSTEVLSLHYKLPGWNDVRRWHPGMPNPQELFDYIAAGGLLGAHNSMMEFSIWHYVCRRRYGWPELPMAQLRCTAAQARVNNYPGALGELTTVLPVETPKNPEGKALINRFCVPQKPTKKQPNKRIYPHEDVEASERFWCYGDDDVRAEECVGGYMMPMSANELRFWLLDQQINWRGVSVDRASVRNMIAVLEQAVDKYGEECKRITGGLLPSQGEKLKGFMAAHGVFMDSMDSDAVEAALETPSLSPIARRVLEIRQLVGSASVKKLYAFERTACSDDRVRGVIIHHGARTGRPTGELVQPLNLPKSGPDMIYCGCQRPHTRRDHCPWCGCPVPPSPVTYNWPEVPDDYEHNPVDFVCEIMATRSLDAVEYFFGDALLAISGCIRGMIVAGPGKELLASDYSSIEAVVTAALSGCKWRLDAFRAGTCIYLASASRITQKPLEWYMANGGKKHPDRQKIGKPAELGLGFGGWLTAWRQFDSTDTFTDDEVKKNILAWRDASPEIVEMWGGQTRGKPWMADYRLERFGFEGAFVNAIQYPGTMFTSHGIRFFMRGDDLIVKLLSDRELVYHSPRLWPSERGGPGVFDITYLTWNSNPKYGAYGWVTMKTYSGRIAENIIQATAHDIQRYGIEKLEAAGYPIVLHVYDEDIAEVPLGFGSIEEFERIMGEMPHYARDWPIRAGGGWRGRRYRKA